MKYALFILVLTFNSLLSMDVSARTVTSFKDSSAITLVALFMYDVAEDLPISSRISDKKINIKDYSQCTNTTASEILKDVEAAIKRVQCFYPDEDIPFDQAIIDLEDYLDNKTFTKCLFIKNTSQSNIKSSYYFDSSNRVHFRLDNIALILE